MRKLLGASLQPTRTAGRSAKLNAEDDGDMIGDTATSSHKLRPACERYDEQIAESITLDLVDEANCWARDGGMLVKQEEESEAGSSKQAATVTSPRLIGGIHSTAK